MEEEKKPDQYLFIREVASITQLHPQTLRNYEKWGLVKPRRSEGNVRLYSLEDVEKIKKIKVFTQDLGINLAGVEVIFKLTEQIEELQKERDDIKKQLEEKNKKNSSKTSLINIGINRVIVTIKNLKYLKRWLNATFLSYLPFYRNINIYTSAVPQIKGYTYGIHLL